MRFLTSDLPLAKQGENETCVIETFRVAVWIVALALRFR